MDTSVEPTPTPFEEEYRIENYRWTRYRQNGVFPKFDEVARDRDRLIANRPFPRTDPPAPYILRPKRRLYGIHKRRAHLSGFDQQDGGKEFNAARTRVQEAKEVFLDPDDEGPLKYVKFLGHGGQGVAMHVQHRQAHFDAVPAPRDFVLKIGLDGWESEAIRKERENLKRVARSAHCIQTIDPGEVGMPYQPDKWKFENPDDLDSESESDSGDDNESVPDIENPLRKTPRWLWAAQRPNLLAQRWEAHENFVQDQRTLIQQRNALKQQEEVRRQDAKGKGKMPENPRGIDPAWDLDHKDFLLLEYAENGTLADLLHKLHDLGEDVPNRVAWQFFLCLVKACIAMEYPVAKFHPRRRERARGANMLAYRMREMSLQGSSTQAGGRQIRPGKIRGYELFESMPPPTRRWAGQRLVHFDIDPQNILVGGMDRGPLSDTEHRFIPRLILGDFGQAKKIRAAKGNNYYLAYRRRGKRGAYAPEQFGIDWEYIAPTHAKGYDLSQSQIAGNYGPHTNVWSIGLVMWQIITKYFPLLPAVPSEQHVPGGPPVHYAYDLEDRRYAAADADLKNLVTQCLMHNPADRPSLHDLLARVEAGTRKQYPQESDQKVRAWVQRVVLPGPRYTRNSHFPSCSRYTTACNRN
ncbi:kinase-like protein [Hypoxylon cercidicola]|nr:kinase-like protein [Hypoxylon cercidicola]